MTNNVNNTKESQKPELLWQQFVAGDMASFRAIYQMYYAPLYRYGLKYLTTDETEDVIQSLFLYILQRKKAISKVTHVKAYLYKSLYHEIIKTLKAKQLQVKELDFPIPAEALETSKEPLFAELLKLLKKLSPRELEIVNLKYYQNYNNLEIANTLGLKNQTVRNTLVSAIKKMRLLSSL